MKCQFRYRNGSVCQAEAVDGRPEKVERHYCGAHISKSDLHTYLKEVLEELKILKEKKNEEA